MMSARPFPTPGDLAQAAGRCGAPLAGAPAPSCQAPAPAAEPAAAPYDRHVWEQAVISSRLHVHARALALVLAHHAGEGGYIPVGDLQHPDRLAEDTGLSQRTIRISLSVLIGDGYLERPSLRAWDSRRGIRPITLTLPHARAHEEPGPPHTGEPR
jgi:hypothetical protein